MVTHALSFLVFIPLLGAVAALIAPARSAKWMALWATGLTLFASLGVLRDYQPAVAGLQFVEDHAWIPSFGVRYIVGVDGLSMPLILLTTLLCFLCVLASWKIENKPQGFFASFLLLQAAMTGVFIAQDLFLFYIYWEIMLLPMYFLIGIWGSPARLDPDGRTRGGPYAAIKFFLYTLIGSLPMLVAVVYMWNETQTFDLRQLSLVSRSVAVQIPLWLCFFVAFAVKIPMFPFHTWLPDAHVEAPTPVSVILAGVLLKMGTYGILRVNFPVFPQATVQLASAVAVFGVINILYGALCAMAQSDMKRLVAYSSISHMGYVMLGMASFAAVGNGAMIREGIAGAALQMWNHGTITAMLFLLVGVFYDRAHHRDINKMGGLAGSMPRYAGFVTFAFFASLGLPGLSGFISEVLILLGTWQVGSGLYKTLVALAALGIVITAAYHLWFIQRAFLGPRKPEYDKFPDLTLMETLTLAPLAIIVIWIGVYPAPMLGFMSATLDQLTRAAAGAALP